MATIYQLIEKAEIRTKDKKAKKAGFMIGIPGELYTKTLDINGIIYVEKIANEWKAFRETFTFNKNTSTSYKLIARSKDLDYVLVKTEQYYKFIKRKL